MGTLNVVGDSLLIEQGSGDKLDYSLDWSDLCVGSDTISSSSWSGDPEITLSNATAVSPMTSIWVTGGTPGQWYAITNTVVTSEGRRGQKTVMLYVTPSSASMLTGGSSLFPNRFAAVAQMRRDSLMLACQNHFAGVTLSDDLIWSKLMAAESEMAHTLRVKLAPTKFFPDTPTQAQIDALPAGMGWDVDPAYDFGPELFGETWGFIQLRNKPLVSFDQLRIAYPAVGAGTFDIPSEWIRSDKKYAQLRIVPTGTVAAVPLSGYLMQALAGGRTIPFMLRITYTAGINARTDYPELVDAVKKMAVLKIITDGFLPQSGSISADGLSQSMSVDMDKYHDTVETIVSGGKGCNGGLMTAIHGVRLGVM